MTDGAGLRRRGWRPRALGAALVQSLVLVGGAPAEAAAQDTTKAVPDTMVFQVRGLHVEVPRPVTTTGGTSAVEVSLDSAGVVAAPTMEEFLRRVPTLQIRANSRGEAQPDLRGAEDRQIAVLLDGIPLTVGWDHRTDLSVIPLTAFRNMRLLRGLSSMLHGPNVLGGAIEFNVGRGSSILSAPPSFLGAVSVDQEGGRSVTATVGTMIESGGVDWTIRGGSGYRARPGVSLPEGAKSDARLNADLLADAQGRRLNSDRQLVDGFLSARMHTGGGAWASALATASNTDRGVPPEAHVKDPRLWRYRDNSRLFVALSGGTGRRSTRRGDGELEASFGLDRTSIAIDQFSSHSFANKIDGETGRTTTLTGRLLGEHVFDDGPTIWSAATVSNVRHTERFESGLTFEYQQLLWSLGTEAEIQIGGGSGADVLNWTLGASVDGSSTPRSGDKDPLGTMWEVGARTGITRSGLGGRVLYHLGVSRRTRFPSLRELYSGALGRFQPNPGLRSENLLGGEAGVTYNHGGIQLQTVGFYNRLGDGIVRSRTTTTQGVRFVRQNRDLVTSGGLEVLAAANRGRFNVGGWLTLQRVRVQDKNRGVDLLAEYTPAVSGTLNLGVVGPRAVAVSGFMRFRGTQYCENVEVSGLDGMNSSVTVDLEARRGFALSGGRFGRSVDGSISVGNLTNTTVLDQCGLPQPGRTVRIQFNVR